MPRLVAASFAAALLFVSTAALSSRPPGEETAAELYRAGAALYDAGRYDAALPKLEAAFEASPDDRTRVLLGAALARLSRCDRALPLLRAIDLEEATAATAREGRTKLSVAFDACGSDLDDEQEAQRLVERVQQRMAVRQYEAARRDAEKARQLAPGDRVLLWLAYTYEVTGNCEGAIRLVRRVSVESLPGDEQAAARERIAQVIEACERPPQDMVYIPGGAFRMGSTRGEPDETPVHEVALSPYYIDRTEVTVDRYERCVDAGACSRERFLSHADKTYCNYGQARRDQYPMNCIDWQGAAEYCAWAGKRLPTEAEWEHAARAPDGRTYPWGEQPPTCAIVVMKSEEGDGCGQDRTWQVASHPRGVSEYGVFDLAGNVWEWVQDWYAADAYARSSERDPRGPAEGERRVMRGGSWLSDAAGRSLRSANRDHDDPSYQGNGVGFRCALSASDVPQPKPKKKEPAGE